MFLGKPEKGGSLTEFLAGHVRWLNRARTTTGRLSPFSDLFKLADFAILDIGARGGAPEWTTPLAPYTRYFACEPDPAAAALLKAALGTAHAWKSVTIVQQALAEPPGPTKLYVTRHTGMSSLLKPNLEVVNTFGLENEFTIEHEVTVSAVTLREAAARYGFEDLSLIKVDTQGTELNILQSGRDLLAGPVQGVFVEVEFRPFYQGQPLFSEVETFLRGLDFELISLEGVTRRRTNTGWRVGYSRREITWAHALFVKRAIEPGTMSANLLFRRTVQQIGIAMAREQFDLAAERLMLPHFQDELARRGLSVGLSDLDSFVQRTFSRPSYKWFCARWPTIEKNRDRRYCRW